MPPRFNSTRTRARNRNAIAKALARQCAQYSEDYSRLVLVGVLVPGTRYPVPRGRTPTVTH